MRLIPFALPLMLIACAEPAPPPVAATAPIEPPAVLPVVQADIGQEQACAAVMARRLRVPITAITFDGRETRGDNAVISLSARDGRRRAICLVDSSYRVKSLSFRTGRAAPAS